MSTPDPQQIMQLQQLGQQLEAEIKALEEQKLQAEKLENDLNKTGQTLRGLRDPDNEQDILIPIGSGVYVYGKITDWQKILVNVGSGTVVPKTLDEAIKTVDKQIENYRNLIQQLSQHIQQKIIEIQSVQDRIQQLQSGNWGIAPGNI